MNKFKPRMYVKSIFDIDYALLKKKGIKVLVFDSDNTIITYDDVLPTEKVLKLFQELNRDFKIFLASNNSKERVLKISNYLNIDGFYKVNKPSKKIKKLLLDKYDISMDNVSIIGDQIVTDVFMGNRLKTYTILVDPLGKRDLKRTYFNRFLERIIMKILRIKRGNYYEEK